jgi:Brp/Blh family beta-carotene 15,15'-monooxygenase
MTREYTAKLPAETWVFLIAGGVLVAVFMLSAGTGAESAWVLPLALAVAIFGLPHGGLDPLVARRAGLWRGWLGFAAFHFGYLALAAAIFGAWYLAPGVSLALFLGYSAWHFGGDWRAHLGPWARFLIGMGVLALPAWLWPSEVERIFALLSGASGVAIAEVLRRIGPLLAVVMLAAGITGRQRFSTTTLELAALVALAWLLPPLIYFAVYFCCLHSLRHLRWACDAMRLRRGLQMLAVTAGYTVLTLLIAAVAWFWLSTSMVQAVHWEDKLLWLLFVGLACLTVPHMLIVGYAEQSKNG